MIKLIFFSLFLLLFLSNKNVEINNTKNFSLIKTNCLSLLKRIIYKPSLGLQPETAPANTIILGFQDNNYHSTIFEFFKNISEDVKVVLVIVDDYRTKEFTKQLKKRKNLKIIRTRDYQGNIWVRDWIPQKVRREDGSSEYVSLTYYAVDNSHLAAEQFSKALKLPHYKSWVEGEMGNIMVDGKGNLFATERIILDNVDRKKGITITKIKNELKSAFGVKKVHILPIHPRDGIVNHIDLTSKYLGNINGKETMIVSDSKRPDVKKSLDKTASILKRLKYKVIRVEEFEGDLGQGTAGFINSLLFNDIVYMPNYSRGFDGDPRRLIELEKNARQIYESLGYKVIEIDSYRPIRNMGAVHCLSCAGEFNW
jgi:agmatine/peptidylarginine deiminase